MSADYGIKTELSLHMHCTAHVAFQAISPAGRILEPALKIPGRHLEDGNIVEIAPKLLIQLPPDLHHSVL